MNCDGIRGLLSAYLDGELSPGDLLRVEQHLRRCHWCADEVDALRQAVSLVASLDEVEVPASFHASLHERLVALGPPVAPVRRLPAARPRPAARRWAMPAVAAAAAFAIGLSVYQQFGPSLTPGLVAETGEFNLWPQVSQAEPGPKTDPDQVTPDNPVGTADPGPDNGTDPGRAPDENPPEIDNPAPIGSPQPDPRNVGVAARPGDVKTPGANLEAQTYTEYELAVPASAEGQLAVLRQTYAAENQNGAWLFKFPASQLADRLKEFEALPGATVTKKTETNIAQEIQGATEKYQVSQEAYAKLQRQFETQAPADPSIAQAQLDAYRSRMEQDQADLELLTQLLETGTIVVRVQ